MAKQQYWLMKTEPSEFSIQDLKKVQREPWDGVRNYQARNFMRDDMKIGDSVLIYHSNSKPSGVAGLARVSRESHPDFTAWDPKDKHFDPKTDPDNPTWMMVEVEFVAIFPSVVSLQALKENLRLDGMLVRKRGMRLSIQPVESKHFKEVVKMGGL